MRRTATEKAKNPIHDYGQSPQGMTKTAMKAIALNRLIPPHSDRQPNVQAFPLLAFALRIPFGEQRVRFQKIEAIAFQKASTEHILRLLYCLEKMGMVSPEKCDRIAQKIDAWVQGVLAQGGGDEQLLEGMYDYMAPFKTVMDNLSPRELDALVNKYDGFYRFTKLLEDMAQAIADGRINPDEFEPKPKKKKPKKGFG